MFLALMLAAGDPPDYVGFSAKAERLAVIATSGASCRHFGYVATADRAALEAFTQRALADAIYAGLDGHVAETMIVSAIEAENRKLEFLGQQSRASAADHARFMEFWAGRCAELAASADASALIHR